MKNKSQYVRLKRQLPCEFDGHSEGERRNERDADESERSVSRAPPRHGETDRRGEPKTRRPRVEREGWKEESGACAVLPSRVSGNVRACWRWNGNGCCGQD